VGFSLANHGDGLQNRHPPPLSLQFNTGMWPVPRYSPAVSCPNTTPRAATRHGGAKATGDGVATTMTQRGTDGF